VLARFAQAAAWTRTLLGENEQLRRRVAELEARQRVVLLGAEEWPKLYDEFLGRIHDLEAENQQVLERLDGVERENALLAQQHAEIEHENNELTNLFVAIDRLHAALAVVEVLGTITEIVTNLIGAEIFAVYVLDEAAGRLEVVAAAGCQLAAFPVLAAGSGSVGSALAAGQIAHDEAADGTDPARPRFCIPLRSQGRPLGAIVIQRLLPRKAGLTALDHELFRLLASHAATALAAARLRARAQCSCQAPEERGVSSSG
jgi:nitrate/nitrite-specific signal transduction histidine kinase